MLQIRFDRGDDLDPFGQRGTAAVDQSPDAEADGGGVMELIIVMAGLPHDDANRPAVLRGMALG
jgi:hypothetical protein